MRWAVFTIFAFLMLILELGLRAMLTLPIGPHDDTAPSFLFVLGVFIALHAPKHLVPWSMIILGLMVDATTTLGIAEPVQDVVIIGPATLGYLLGGFVAFQLRSIVSRQSPATLPIVIFVAGMFTQLLIIALVTMRGLPFVPSDPVPNWYLADQLAQRFLQLIYTTALAIPLGIPLQRTQRFWRFQSSKSNVYGGRAAG